MKINSFSKKVIMLLVWLIAQQFLMAQNTESKFLKVKEIQGIEEYKYLPNDLGLLLVQDNTVPVATIRMVYHVGSRHEVTGYTGAAHLLEHLQFKGTAKFNKRKENSIDKNLLRMGAQFNASTWTDGTDYFETIPSDKIALALEIEADRMRNSLLLQEDKEAEMTVVRNEFERGANDPGSILSTEIWATAYMAHPYHHNTIGWLSDIEQMPNEVLRKFYDTYYWPNNATLIIAGDFQKKELFATIDRYFGKISKSPHPIPQPYTTEPEQTGPRKVVVKKPGETAMLSKAYKIPGILHKDMAALTILGKILSSGPSSILSKTLLDTEKALYANAGPENNKELGLFSLDIAFDTSTAHESIEKQLTEIIEKIKKEGVDQAAIDRVVSKYTIQIMLDRDGTGSIAAELPVVNGDWTEYFNETEKLKKVTVEDIKFVANTYLKEDQSTTGYFIPEDVGLASSKEPNKATYKVKPNNRKFYYRTPKENNNMYGTDHVHLQFYKKKTDIIKSTLAQDRIEEKYIRKNVSGINVISVKTGTKNLVTLTGSIPIGSYFNTDANKMAPDFAVYLLNKGTLKNDKFSFSEKLEKLGGSLSLSPGQHDIWISSNCLKKDVPAIIDLLAEQLQYPLYDKKEFNILKKQFISSLQQALTDPSDKAFTAFTQQLFPKKHPSYRKDVKAELADIQNLTLKDIKSFHKIFFGPAGMQFVVVGDVDRDVLYQSIEKSFKGWSGGKKDRYNYDEPKPTIANNQIITVPEKPSASLILGQYTGLKKSDPDYLPFYLANAALGGGFSGRLMRTVRDVAGLTYSIRSDHSNDTFSGGYWSVRSSFNPELLQKGLEATIEQLKKWRNKGLTQSELDDLKANIKGSYQVGLSTTFNIANSILTLVNRGKDPNYLDQYPKDIEKVTLEQVNASIKKYIDLDRLVIIKSGSIDKDGKPLKSQ